MLLTTFVVTSEKAVALLVRVLESPHVSPYTDLLEKYSCLRNEGALTLTGVPTVELGLTLF